MSKLHVVNLKCGKYNKVIDITDMTDEEVEKLKKQYFIKGQTILKVI